MSGTVRNTSGELYINCPRIVQIRTSCQVDPLSGSYIREATHQRAQNSACWISIHPRRDSASGEQHISSFRIVHVGLFHHHRIVHPGATHRMLDIGPPTSGSYIRRATHEFAEGSACWIAPWPSGLCIRVAQFLLLAVLAVGAVGAVGAARLEDVGRVSPASRQSRGIIFVSRPLERYLCICHS